METAKEKKSKKGETESKRQRQQPIQLQEIKLNQSQVPVLERLDLIPCLLSRHS